MIIFIVILALVATFIVYCCLIFSGRVAEKSDEDVENDIREMKLAMKRDNE